MDALSRRLARLAASGFGVGRAPAAPGTAASIIALLLGARLMHRPRALRLAALGASLGGIWAVGASGATGDPGWVVIDEIAGQWITLLGLRRASPRGLLAALAVFRLLDIAKPGPIGWADRRSGPLGVMGDDVIAGATGAMVLWVVGGLVGRRGAPCCCGSGDGSDRGQTALHSGA